MARTTTKRDAASALIRRQVEVFADRPLHLPHRGSGVDGGDELLALEDLDERLGLLVVLGETDGERLGVVVVTSREAATAHVADVGHLRTVRDQVVVEAALRAQPPCEYPTMHLLVGQVEVDDPVDVVALQEELCLPGAAREPVDDEAVVPVMVVQSLPDDCLDDVVADQPPSGNGAAYLGAELGVMLHVPPEDVADADVLEVEVVGEQLGLRSLAAALDAHDHELAHGVSQCPESEVDCHRLRRPDSASLRGPRRRYNPGIGSSSALRSTVWITASGDELLTRDTSGVGRRTRQLRGSRRDRRREPYCPVPASPG